MSPIGPAFASGAAAGSFRAVATPRSVFDPRRTERRSGRHCGGGPGVLLPLAS